MELFKDIATVVGCITACIGLLTLIFRPIRKLIIKFIITTSGRNEVMKQKNVIDELKELIDERTKSFNDSVNELKEDIKRNNDGTLNSLRYQLYEKTEQIFNRGHIQEKERELLNDMYNAYTSLNGDSYISDRVHRALDMPTRN